MKVGLFVKKVARQEEEKLIPSYIRDEINVWMQQGHATLAIAVMIFIQVILVCELQLPVVVGYLLLFVSIAIACNCIWEKNDAHNRIMKLWEQLTKI